MCLIAEANVWLVSSEHLIDIWSISWQLIIMEALPKVVVGKGKQGGFGSQQLLFWERCWKSINRPLGSVFGHTLDDVEPLVLWKIWKAKACVRIDFTYLLVFPSFNYVSKERFFCEALLKCLR